MIDEEHDIIIKVIDFVFWVFRFKIERCEAFSLSTDLLTNRLKNNMKLFFIE
jgi:hypothetical protein